MVKTRFDCRRVIREKSLTMWFTGIKLLSAKPLIMGACSLLVAARTSAQVATEDYEIDYEYLGMFPPEGPTLENPIFFMRFNSEILLDFPRFNPAIDLPVFQRDKFIIINFVDPAHRERSIIQMSLTRDLARDLNPLIYPKKFLIADVFVRDSNGEPLYVVDYELLYEMNQLGLDNTFEERRIIPYGVAFSSSLSDPSGGVQRMMDFSVSRFNQSNEQMRENIGAIAGNLHGCATHFVNPIDPNSSD